MAASLTLFVSDTLSAYSLSQSSCLWQTQIEKQAASKANHNRQKAKEVRYPLQAGELRASSFSILWRIWHMQVIVFFDFPTHCFLIHSGESSASGDLLEICSEFG